MAGSEIKPRKQSNSEISSDRPDPGSILETSRIEAVSQEQLQIIQWLKTVRFRKQLFGGLTEQDVWKKIEELNEMYEAALRAERIRYDVLLEERCSQIEKASRSAGSTKEGWIDD